MGNERVLNRTRQTESFANKANILQLDLDTQVDMLNTIYKGKVRFGRQSSFDEKESGIVITYIARDIISIELPEVEGYNIKDLIDYRVLSEEYKWDKHLGLVASRTHSKLCTVKMPKCLDELRITSRYSWMNRIQRLFVWDTTKLEFDNDNRPKLDMVVVLSSNGSKPKIIKINS